MLRFVFDMNDVEIQHYIDVVRELLSRSLCVVETRKPRGDLNRIYYIITCVYTGKHAIAHTRIRVTLDAEGDEEIPSINRWYCFRIAFTLDVDAELELDEFEKQLLAFASANDSEPLLRPM